MARLLWQRSNLPAMFNPIRYWSFTLVALLCALACGSGKKTASNDAATPAQPCCDGTIYEVPEVDVPPSYPGGEAAMYAWVGNNLKTPELPAGADLSNTTTWVQFNVDCDGSVRDPVVKRGSLPELDASAMELVMRMPKWSPGEVKDRPVCVQYILPLKFEAK